mgnify:CR=1 FL=1
MKLTRRRFVRGIIFVCNPFDEDQSEERKRRDDQHDLSLFFLQFSETKKRTYYYINETTIFRGPFSRPIGSPLPHQNKKPLQSRKIKI